MSYLIGIDGGGTRTTLVIADSESTELLRMSGPPGLVDPRDPDATAEMLAGLAREAISASGQAGLAAALCAGLAGVGHPEERERVESYLREASVAQRVSVITDGEIALSGALGNEPGILLIAGTGSVAYGRAADGRVLRAGGWGMHLGDEGSGYGLGRAGLTAALRGHDGRGPATVLIERLLEALSLEDPDAIPPWIGRARKAQVAALAVHVLEAAAAGDAVAEGVLEEAVQALLEHAVALAARLDPWPQPPALVMHGGVAQDREYQKRFRKALAGCRTAFDLREPRADAVAGALLHARDLARSAAPQDQPVS